MKSIKFLFLLISILIITNQAYSVKITDPGYQDILNKLQTQDSVKIILELQPDNSTLKEKKVKDKTKQKLFKYEQVQVKDAQNKTKNKLINFNKDKIKEGKFTPFMALEVNSSNVHELLNIDEIKTVKEDELEFPSLLTSVPQIGADIGHLQGYEGDGQAIVILDTGFDSDHPLIAGKMISEACYSSNLCPGGFTETTAEGSAEHCVGNSDCDHGTHVAGIALGDNGAGVKGVAPNANLIGINVFSDVCGARLCSYVSDQILGLERAVELSNIYDIAAVSMSLGGGSYTSNCDVSQASRKEVIDALRAKGIPTIISSGNDGYTNAIGAPACISTAFAIGSSTDSDTVSGFSNSDEQIDLLAPGDSIYSGVVGGGYATWGGTSMAAPHVSGAWALLKSANPTSTLDEIFNILNSTGTPITDAKNGITKPRINVDLVLEQIIIPIFEGGSNVLDVIIDEKSYETVTFNPLVAGTGSFYDKNENQSLYEGNGTITVINNHLTESIESIELDMKNIQNIYNVSFLSGTPGFVSSIDSYFLHLKIPDLGPGKNTTFRYDIDLSSITPPLNFTTNYLKDKILAGYDLEVYDTIQNSLNQTNYNNTCIYNINIQQNALDFEFESVNYNFTFDNTSIQGTDATNTSFPDNQTLIWTPQNNQCLYPTNQTDINYNLRVPSQVNMPDDYDIINTTISYQFNETISQMDIQRVKSSVNLELEFNKMITSILTGDNATWQIGTLVSNPSNISVNLKKVSLWVSERNGTGTGFTNPSIQDRDTISNEYLFKNYFPHMLLNDSIPYNNTGTEWMFNYTYSSSPILWMDLDNDIIDNDVQITDSAISIGDSYTYTKQIYITTGYLIEITKNVTRLSEANYTIDIEVQNKGPSIIPPGQVVVIYNFLPNTFNLESNFGFSQSSWYSTQETNTSLNDAIYNGTMYQFALTPTNAFNSSLSSYQGVFNSNNTWSVSYNVSGVGEFQFDDLFLTGVDPLHVESIGSTQSIGMEANFKVLSSSIEYFMGITSMLVIVLLFLI